MVVDLIVYFSVIHCLFLSHFWFVVCFFVVVTYAYQVSLATVKKLEQEKKDIYSRKWNVLQSLWPVSDQSALSVCM